MGKLNYKNFRNRESILLIIGLFLLIAVPLTVISIRKSDETAKPTQAATPRDFLKQPFASWSIWNLPIGANAQYVPSNIKDWISGSHFPQGVKAEENYIFNWPNPLPSDWHITTIETNNTGWPGSNNRCSDQGATVFSGVSLPRNYLIGKTEEENRHNNSAAILSPNRLEYWQTQPLTHCTTTSPWTTLPYNKTIVSVSGDGILGDQGRSGMSAIGGAIRKGEWTEARARGYIPHALKTVLDSGPNYGRSAGPDCGTIPGCRWPAVASDCGNTACGYDGGTAQNHVKMGTLLAVHPSVNCNTYVVTEPAKILCRTLQNYGMYIVDSGISSAYIPVEYGPAPGPEAIDEFQQQFGFTMESGFGNQWSTDWRKIITNSHVVDNWRKTLYDQVRVSNGSQGAGGGAPRVCWSIELNGTEYPCGGTNPPPPPTDTTPPTVSLTTPLNGTTVSGSSVTLSATATDNVGVSRVEFFVNNQSVNNDTTEPYSFGWNSTTLPNGSYPVFARAFDAAGNQGSTTPITINVNNTPTLPLPSPWQTTDIGSVGVAGSASYSSGVFTLNGSGTDIWGTNDSFRFVYQDLVEYGSIVARVTSQTNTDPWAKAGIMVRESLNANSKHAMMIVSPSNGTAFQYRTTNGGNTEPSGVTSPGTFPIWLKLIRNSSTISGYTSTDGVNFSQVGTVSLSMPNTVKIGLLVLSHNNTMLGQAQFSNVTVADCGVPGGASCPPPAKPGDLNNDGAINSGDMAIILAKWGTTDPAADLNGSGRVDSGDLAFLIARWGT